MYELEHTKRLAQVLKIAIGIGGAGILFDPWVTLLTSRRLDDDGGAQLTICEIMYNNAQGRPSFAVFQTLFASSVTFNALRWIQDSTVAQWATVSLFIELFAYSTPYMNSPGKMQMISLIINYLNILLLNFIDVQKMRESETQTLRTPILAMASIITVLVGIDSLETTNFTKQYHLYFALEWIGLVAYVVVQLYFSRVFLKVGKSVNK